jgi:hypothetical protein
VDRKAKAAMVHAAKHASTTRPQHARGLLATVSIWASPDTYPARGEQGPTLGKVLRNTGWSQCEEYKLGLGGVRGSFSQRGGDSGARAAAGHGRQRRRRWLVGSGGGGGGGSCGGLRVASVA